jgi:hypothetical protein
VGREEVQVLKMRGRVSTGREVMDIQLTPPSNGEVRLDPSNSSAAVFRIFSLLLSQLSYDACI